MVAKIRELGYSAVDIFDAVDDIKAKADMFRQPYFFIFKGIRVEVFPDESSFDIINRYQIAFNRIHFGVNQPKKLNGLIVWLRN